jgi:beta-glucanase (GH16 family)
MGTRPVAILVVLVVVVVVLTIAWLGPGGPELALGPSAIPTASSIASPAPTSPATTSPYTFDDEFDGPGLSSAWQQHFSCCGTLAGVDPGLATVSGGLLSMAVEHRSDGWYGALVDTKTTFTQRYGTFEARIRIPSGAGLWPAFWSYISGGGTQAEIDTMEVCGGREPGGGSILHNTVYWSARDSLSNSTPTVDLTTDFHVYAVDWRPDHVTFLLDGRQVWSFPAVSHIPAVPLPVILDLGVGGSFCGPPDASTPARSQMLVDWVRVLP